MQEKLMKIDSVAKIKRPNNAPSLSNILLGSLGLGDILKMLNLRHSKNTWNHVILLTSQLKAVDHHCNEANFHDKFEAIEREHKDRSQDAPILTFPLPFDESVVRVPLHDHNVFCLCKAYALTSLTYQ